MALKRALHVTVALHLTVALHVTVALVLAVAVLPGCASSGADRSGAALDGAAQLRMNLTQLARGLEATSFELEGVAKHGADQNRDDQIRDGRARDRSLRERGLRAAFDDYAAALGRLDTAAAGVSSGIATFGSRADAHLAAWAKEIAALGNEEIRARSEERRAEAQASFDRLRTELRDVESGTDAARADFRDIRVALDNDLNRVGVAAMADPIQAATGAAREVRKSVDAVVAHLDELTAALTPTPPDDRDSRVRAR